MHVVVPHRTWAVDLRVSEQFYSDLLKFRSTGVLLPMQEEQCRTSAFARRLVGSLKTST